MKDEFKAVKIDHKDKKSLSSVKAFGVENTKKVSEFHQSFPEYDTTPLVSLSNLAKELGVANIYVKDESYRFGLNAFKVLGGSYAIGTYLAKKLSLDISELPYDKMVSESVREQLGDITFITATDGNHGRGVAWTANRLKQNSVVYMPKGSATERLENIKNLGSDASILELYYDDAVRLADSDAQKNGWVFVQDTAFENYEEIPTWIMQGYTTIAHEAVKQLNGKTPTHVFLQAGVGALSGALTAYFADYFEEQGRPIITIVEPNKADCIYQTAKANDGKLRVVKGALDTIMAGLACGEPCTIGWDILKDHADNFVSMPDHVAAKGMRILGNPIKDDGRIVSGESGAASIGLIADVMTKPSLKKLKEQLQLDENSVVLCISTEGDTDQVGYRDIVWNGAFQSL